MGEIADMMIDGTLDYITGEYIGKGGGYPRTTQKEWREYEKNNKWRTVLHFLWSKKIKSHMHPQVFKDYGCAYPRKSPLKKVCNQVLPEFEKFKEFVNQNLDKYSFKNQ
jgi:hypothetical protein